MPEIKKLDDTEFIDSDVLEHEMTIRLVLGCPLKELKLVRRAINKLIIDYDVREIDKTEEY
jgi:hypothetical protein